MREQGKSLKKAIRAALAVGALCLFAVPAAQAADGVYWGNLAGGKLTFSPLSGGRQDIETGAATGGFPSGVAIDPVTERIYWASVADDKISFANLDGTGGGTLNTSGAPIVEPGSVAIDPVGRRIYWGSNNSTTISYANLDGSGGGSLNPTNVHDPSGLAIDPVAHRLYWANEAFANAGEAIGSVNLDGSDERFLSITGAEVKRPHGLAIDPALGRIYWANFTATPTISYANLDGSGGANLDTTGATVAFPEGVAIDPIAGRVYWANRLGRTISSASVTGGGGADIQLEGEVQPNYPLLAVSPRATGAPAIAGGAAAGSALSCSQGGWAPDSIESFFYAAPHTFAFQWSVDGVDIPGATQSTLTAGPKGGDYRCRVSAANHAGTTAQTSAAHHVAAAPTPPVAKPGSGRGNGGGSESGAAKLSLALTTKKVPAKGPVSIAVTNEGAFAVGGTLSGLAFKWAGGARKDPPLLAAVHFKAAANGKAIVKLKLPKVVQAVLAAGKSVPLKLSAAFADGAGKPQTLTKTVIAKAAAKARP